MVQPAERNGVFVADFAAQRAGLGKPDMMRVRGSSSTDDARLSSLVVRFRIANQHGGSPGEIQ